MSLQRVVSVLAIISLLAYSIALWSGQATTTELSAANTALSTSPLSGLPPWPTFVPPTPPSSGVSCAAWDLPCHINVGAATVAYATAYIAAAISYSAAAFVQTIVSIVSFASWLIGAIVAISSATWAIIRAPITLFPTGLEILGYAFLVPMWVSVGVELLKIVRGAP